VIEQGRQIIEDNADAKRDFQSVRARSHDQAQFAEVHVRQVGELKREENLFNSMSFTFRVGRAWLNCTVSGVCLGSRLSSLYDFDGAARQKRCI
jgi:hypothetical protein